MFVLIFCLDDKMFNIMDKCIECWNEEAKSRLYSTKLKFLHTKYSIQNRYFHIDT